VRGRATRQVKDQTPLENAAKVVLVLLAGTLFYTIVLSIYNELVGEDRQVDVVTSALYVALVGSLSFLLAWGYQNDRRKR